MDSEEEKNEMGSTGRAENDSVRMPRETTKREETNEQADKEDASFVPEVLESNAPPKKRRSRVWTIVLIALIAIGIYCLFGISGELPSEGEVFGGIDPVGVVILLCVILGLVTVELLKFFILNKTVIGKVRPIIALKTHFIGKYYDGITPFAAGGQPMQIYYMTTKGVSGADSSAVVLIKYFGSIFSLIIVGACGMIVSIAGNILSAEYSVFYVIGWIGLAFNLIVPLFILLFVCFPKFARKLTNWFISLGAKLRIVKDKEKTMGKAIKTVTDFIVSFRIIAARPLQLILFLLMCFAESFLVFTVPYFAMQALSCDVSGKFLTVFVLNIITTFGVSIIPTPGNSGVIEGVGVLAFSAVTTGASLAWSLLVWRFLTYYMYIIIGLAISFIDIVVRYIGKGKTSVKSLNAEHGAAAETKKNE